MYVKMFVGVFVTTVVNLDLKIGLKNDRRLFTEIIRGDRMLTQSCCHVWIAA